MNAKTIIGLVCLCTVSVGSFIAYKNYSSQPTISTREQCFAGSIDACISLDKTNKQLYRELEVTQQKIAENNKEIKEQAAKLLSGSSFQ